jgi:hypothetical protein
MIADLLRPIVESLTAIPNPEGPGTLAFTFYHMETYEMNENDSPAFPFVHLVHPVKWNNTSTGLGVEYKDFPVQLFFLTKSLLEKKMVEREGQVNAMHVASDEFIEKIEQAIATPIDPATAPDYWITEIIDKSRGEELFNEFDSNMDGVLITITIRVARKCLT